jgi:hypothetical protein
MSSFTWEPWEQNQIKLNKIKRPPCEHCLYWEPVKRKTETDYGARLCHAPDMYSDFSCFQKKPHRKRKAVR